MLEINDIKEYISNKEKLLIEKEVRRDTLNESKEKLNTRLNESKEYIELYEKTVILLQHAISYARQQSKILIEKIVTECLRYVFKTNIRFIIKDEITKKSAGMEFYVTDENGNVDNLTKPEDSRGGGIVDVVSLGLRLSISQILTSNGVLGPIILDEPAKYVSNDYISNVGLYLKDFAAFYDRQIIMVTHDNYLSEIGNAVFQVEQTKGLSSVKKVYGSNLNIIESDEVTVDDDKDENIEFEGI